MNKYELAEFSRTLVESLHQPLELRMKALDVLYVLSLMPGVQDSAPAFVQPSYLYTGPQIPNDLRDVFKEDAQQIPGIPDFGNTWVSPLGAPPSTPVGDPL